MTLGSFVHRVRRENDAHLQLGTDQEPFSEKVG